MERGTQYISCVTFLLCYPGLRAHTHRKVYASRITVTEHTHIPTHTHAHTHTHTCTYPHTYPTHTHPDKSQQSIAQGPSLRKNAKTTRYRTGAVVLRSEYWTPALCFTIIYSHNAQCTEPPGALYTGDPSLFVEPGLAASGTSLGSRTHGCRQTKLLLDPVPILRNVHEQRVHFSKLP